VLFFETVYKNESVSQSVYLFHMHGYSFERICTRRREV